MLSALERPVAVPVFRAGVSTFAVAAVVQPFENYPLYIPHVVRESQPQGSPFCDRGWQYLILELESSITVQDLN